MKTQKKNNSNKQNNGSVPQRPNGELAHAEIALAAYSLWVEEGRPQGRHLDHWIRAEAVLKQTRQQTQAQSASPAQQ